MAQTILDDTTVVRVDNLSAFAGHMFNSTRTQEQIDAEAMVSMKSLFIFIFEGTLVPIIGSIGFFGNILSILVLKLRDLDLKPSFANLLVTLCIFDMIFILAVILFYTIPIHSIYYEEHAIPYITPFLLPLIHIALTGSVYSVVAVAMERYCIICNPFNWQNQGRGFRYIIAIVVFSLLYNLNKFFEVEVGYVEVPKTELVNETTITITNTTKAIVTITSLRGDALYTKVVILLNFLIMVVVPLTMLSLCHYLTFAKIRENTKLHNTISNNQRRDNAMAALFFLIIGCFLICHSGKFVLNFFEISTLFNDKDEAWPTWTFVLTRFNHLMLVINSSVNFFIYCFRDARFRCAVFSIFGLNVYDERAASSSPKTQTISPFTKLCQKINDRRESQSDTEEREEHQLVRYGRNNNNVGSTLLQNEEEVQV